MLDIKEHIKKLKQDNRETYALLRNPILASVVEAANRVEEAMRAKGSVPHLSLNTNGVTLIYTLNKQQSLKDMRPFLKAIAKTRLFCPAVYRAEAKYGYVEWKFTTKDGTPCKTLTVNVWLGQSVSCRKVATGRMTEEYEVVCDEIPAELLEV